MEGESIDKTEAEKLKNNKSPKHKSSKIDGSIELDDTSWSEISNNSKNSKKSEVSKREVNDKVNFEEKAKTHETDNTKKIENSLAQTKKSLYLRPQVADEGKKEECKGQLEEIIQSNPPNICEILEDLSNKISNEIKDYAKSSKRNEIWDIDFEEDTIIAHIQNDSFKIARTVSYYSKTYKSKFELICLSEEFGEKCYRINKLLSISTQEETKDIIMNKRKQTKFSKEICKRINLKKQRKDVQKIF